MVGPSRVSEGGRDGTERLITRFQRSVDDPFGGAVSATRSPGQGPGCVVRCIGVLLKRLSVGRHPVGGLSESVAASAVDLLGRPGDREITPDSGRIRDGPGERWPPKEFLDALKPFDQVDLVGQRQRGGHYADFAAL